MEIHVVCNERIWEVDVLPLLKDLVHKVNGDLSKQGLNINNLNLTVRHLRPNKTFLKGNYSDVTFYHYTVQWDIPLSDLLFRTDKLVKFNDTNIIQEEIYNYVKAYKEKITETGKSSCF